MRTTCCIAALLMLTGHAALAKDPDAIDLSRQILTRENSRLSDLVQSTKNTMRA